MRDVYETNSFHRDFDFRLLFGGFLKLFILSVKRKEKKEDGFY